MSEEKTTTPIKGAAATDRTPQWLKAELFEDLLKQNVDGFKEIKSFKAVPGTVAGENYATVMLRIEMEVELEDNKSQTYSLMMKLGHDYEVYKEIMKNNNIFDVENEMYFNIVPELEQLYRDVGVEVKFGAKGYKIEAPVDYVLLENLATKGFKNTNRLEGLDIEHTQCVLRKVAQWHAASAVRVAKKGSYSDNIKHGFFKLENKEMFQNMMQSMSKQFLECMNAYEGHEEYSEQVKALQPHYTDLFYEVSIIDPNNFNALNHGDLWSNNIMFQYDDNGKITETYLVDYQVPKFGSVAQDLQYFLISSTKLEHKLSKFNYYIKYYHDHLIENLKLLKYNKELPKLRDIHASLYRYGLWSYSTASGVMAAVLVDPTEKANFENFLSDSADGDSFKNLMYSNARYRKHIEAILPWLLNRGVFEV